ncbi:MAG: protein kinase [Planctomycetaceae bacterium]
MRFTHQPGTQPLEGFTIHRGIHRGGFGEVYYARSEGGKEVALKLLQREQDVELRGVRQCLNLKHPNLVNLFDVRTDTHGEQWVVMEYINGSSLEDVLASFPNGLPLDEVKEWLNGIAAGVTFLHDRGIVHRDLKPANVYRENGTVKVGDVGLSKRLGTDRRANHTQSVGTVYYMAPEVARGEYGPEVDVYSLGIMLYEMLTGQLPFMGETTAEVLMKHLTATPRLELVAESLRPVLAHALAKDPRQRTSSAFELTEEFRNALDVTSGNQPAPSGFANGSVHSRSPLADTPPTGATVSSDTSVSVRVTTPVSTRSPAQSASAYAQYPTEHRSPESATTNSTKQKSTKASQPRVHVVSSQAHVPTSLNWSVILGGMVLLLMFAPGTWLSWMGIALLAFACSATSVLRGRHGGRVRIDTATNDPEVNAKLSGALLGYRPIIADTTASLAAGSAGAALFSLGILFTGDFFRATTQSLTPEFVTMFVTISVIGTWLVLACEQLRQRNDRVKRNSRKTFLMAGLLTGLAAYGLDQYLLVEFTRAAGYSPVFARIGIHPLMDSGMNPSLLGYLVFFGGFLFIYRYWEDMNPRRPRQLSVGRLLTAAITAWLMTIVFAFPQWPAVFWAVTMSAAVQLASPWTAAVRQTVYQRGQA